MHSHPPEAKNTGSTGKHQRYLCTNMALNSLLSHILKQRPTRKGFDLVPIAQDELVGVGVHAVICRGVH